MTTLHYLSFNKHEKATVTALLDTMKESGMVISYALHNASLKSKEEQEPKDEYSILFSDNYSLFVFGYLKGREDSRKEVSVFLDKLEQKVEHLVALSRKIKNHADENN